jgi:hypothetical protein
VHIINQVLESGEFLSFSSLGVTVEMSTTAIPKEPKFSGISLYQNLLPPYLFFGYNHPLNQDMNYENLSIKLHE